MIGSDQLITQLLETLTAFENIQLRLDPDRIIEYQMRIKSTPDFSALVKTLRAVELPEAQAWPQRQILKAAAHLTKAKESFLAAAPGRAGIMQAFRSLRFFCRTYEALYPLAVFYKQIDRFFLEPGEDIPSRSVIQPSTAMPVSGIVSTANERGQRGGFTQYVPEDYSPDKSWPLVVALHGGSGHGADFFWSWLKTARSRGLILVAPSSPLNTWSLDDPNRDGSAILEIISAIQRQYRIDSERTLVTGLSDGGTFAMMLASLKNAAFTHAAPIASAAHAFGPHAMQFSRKKIYMVHGLKDWMFPVVPVRQAAAALKAAGAEIVYREIADLSHNYPRDENRAIIDWFTGSLRQ